MTTEATIVPALPEDYAAVADIWNEHIRSGRSTMDETLKTPEYVAGWVGAFTDREALFVLKTGDEALGWGNVRRYSDRAGYRFACETSVFLRGDVRGRGWGKRMKVFLMEKCRELGYRHIVNRIMATNVVSVAYNKKLGFEVVGIQKEIGFKNGEWVDVVILSYVFGE